MKISVIIPTHNRADLLIRAVESVLNQTYTNLEVIIISDGSTDNTNQVLNALEKKDMRVTTFSYTQPKGANYARNKGINMSTGKYIAFLDDDDEWYKDKIDSQLRIFKSDETIGLVYTGKKVKYIDENKEYTSLSKKSGDLSKEILKGNPIGTTSSVMVKKNVIDQTGYFDEEMPAMQDYELWIRICQITNVGVVPEEKVIYYNEITSNQISSNTIKYEKSLEKIFLKHKSLYDNLSEIEYKERKVRANLSLAKRSLRNGQKKKAYNYTKKSLSIKITLKGLLHLPLIMIPFKYQLKIRSII